VIKKKSAKVGDITPVKITPFPSLSLYSDYITTLSQPHQPLPLPYCLENLIRVIGRILI
jgi:hypothetical protein